MVPNAEEVALIKEKTAMVEVALPFEYKDGQVAVATELKVNDVVLIKIYA